MVDMIKEIFQLKKYDAQIKAISETFKEFIRWALSLGISWILTNGFQFFQNSKLDPNIIFVIGACFRAADYYWHKYNKELQPESTGKSLGLFRI